MGTFEDLVDLHGSRGALEALLYHIGREFKLTEASKIGSDEVEDLIITLFTTHFHHILDEIVAERALDEHSSVFDDHVR